MLIYWTKIWPHSVYVINYKQTTCIIITLCLGIKGKQSKTELIVNKVSCLCIEMKACISFRLKPKYKLMTKSFLPDMYEPAYMRRKESKQNMIMYMCYILLVLLQYVVYCGKSDKLNTRKIVSLSLLTSILKLNASNGLALTAIQEINKSPTVDQVPNVRTFS